MGIFNILSREDRKAVSRDEIRKQLLSEYNRTSVLANHTTYLSGIATTNRDNSKKKLLDFLAEEDDVLCGLKRLEQDLDRGTGPLGDISNGRNALKHFAECKYIKRYIQETTQIRLDEIERGIK